LFVDDADFANVVGPWWHNKADIQKAHQYGLVILPFLMGSNCRIYAAILSFCIGVIPPMPILGRSLLYVHSHRVA
jgi:hypothetical protein